MDYKYRNLASQFPPPTQQQISASTYDDILASLNVKVNNGVLEFINPQEKFNYNESQEYFPNQNKKTCSTKTCPLRQPQPQPHPQQSIIKSEQNSYIYNKYFKSYVNNEEEEEINLENMTPEERKMYLIEKHNEKVRQMMRVRQIKSTKLMFNNGGNNNISVSTPNQLNKMFRII